MVISSSFLAILENNGSTTKPSPPVPSTLESNLGTVNVTKPENELKPNETQVETNIKLPTSMDNSTSTDNSTGTAGSTQASDSAHGANSGRRLLEDINSKGSQEAGSESTVNNKDTKAATVENDEGLEADADSSFDLFRDNDELPDEYGYDYDDYVDETMWGDEEWTESQHEKLEDYVNIDAHILCTPVSEDTEGLWTYLFSAEI